MPKKTAAVRKGGGGGGRSFWGKGGLEGEITANLVDVVCTWMMLGGMCLSAVWINWAVPRLCADADPSDKFLTFSCVDRVVFGYIFCFIGLSTALLPPHTTNPWECIFIPLPVPRRLVKFGLQITAAALFAAGLQKANSQFAEELYRDVFPRVKLCGVKPFSAHHAKVFAGVDCTPEFPSWGENGRFSLGVVVVEALHVFALNFAAAIVLPRMGKLIPLAVPCLVITAIRSPFSYLPGPALNMIPATAGAILHGGLDSWRAHLLGCGLGMTLVYLLERRLRMHFSSVFSFRAPSDSMLDVDGASPRRLLAHDSHQGSGRVRLARLR